MRARLEAMAQPRDSDNPAVAELRAALRDPVLMAGVVDEIADTWDFTPEQLDTLAVLLRRPNSYRKPTTT
ncbi:putative metal-dependent phosphotriesterase family hydrolase [Kribbella aluminosa]|uniref:Metal-dependent phosphotriesterase family hydrolase n=1 Tax=Kribbella aluminosa TaxID=416017 RepID=A0ABS4ULR8_9ACTN|nr:putative metal-dependent phosphotriesterase family hydrolase [Kribbella aluminosa]